MPEKSELILREQLKLLSKTCVAQALLVPAWTLVYLIFVSGIWPALGNASSTALIVMASMILTWAAAAIVTGRLISKWTEQDKLSYAVNISVILFTINGAIGGGSIWLFWEEGNISSNIFLTMAMLIILCVHLVELSIHKSTFFAGIASLSLMVFSRLATSSSDIANLFAVFLPALICTFAFMGWRRHQGLVEHIETRLEKEVLNHKLEQASEAKERLFASVSHDLKTPLNAISGFSQILEMEHFGKLNKGQKEYISHIRQAADHLNTLIKDILSLSALRAGGHDIQCEMLPIQDAIEQASHMLVGAYPNAESRLKLDMPEEPAIGYFDQPRLVECVLNLLTNAEKYTPEGTPIRVELQTGDTYHHIHVLDEGPGLNDAQIEAAMQPYARIERDGIEKISGSGLGLAIVKLLMDRQQGNFELKRREDKGLCATLVVSANVPTSQL